jgi:hypothetical protein
MKDLGRFTNGAHPYRGPHNSRAKRLSSKIHKGIKPIRAQVWRDVERSLRP